MFPYLREKRYLKMKAELTQSIEPPLTRHNDSLTFQNNVSNSTSGDTQSWNDIVFEKRNRDYGAYVLRASYGSNVIIGVVVTLLAIVAVILFPYVAERLSDEPVKNVVPRKMVYTELSTPPPIDKPKPLPPVISLPKLQKIIKFVPPRVVKEQVVETAPTIEEIKANDVAAVAVEGPVTVEFAEPVEQVVEVDDNQIFTVVEQAPDFEGGYDALMRWVKQTMVYPANARRMDMEGTVYLSFVVGKTGVISDVTVLKGFMAECDKEAVRVARLMPPWKPGKQNGRAVSVRFTLPLKFRLK
jgi:periplasmic protein TonB